MDKTRDGVRTVFDRALEIQSPIEREAYLDEACAGNIELRKRVDALLKAYDGAASFLESPPAELERTIDLPPIQEGPGTMVGRYKILQRIGEGGFGVVFMAEQREPVVRKVALKIIKPGMDTKEVIARFEAERQALALMDHANIARVLEAGSTETGRPYFVMELVKGVPITEYCDKNELPAEERLKLFVAICRAVQHAHQKGIIHRDIKPTNILVTLHDGHPVPKVIDFGVSKATSQRLTEKTLFTAYGQMIGTPQYMSPEQAEMSGLDVDTRSDVYSLGVLLYELLTGTTPLEADRLRTAAYLEMQRMIREEDPPKPSVRLSTLGDRLTVIAKHRSTDPKRLRQAIRGELDWIVMKSLEKERGRRYESPASFAADVERFLSGQPVEAHPPSAMYRLCKLVRRNKATTLALLFIWLLLSLGTVAGFNAMRMNQRLEELVERYRDVLFREAVSMAMAGDPAATQKIEEAHEAGVAASRLEMLHGQLKLYGEDMHGSIEHLRRAVDLSQGNVAARGMLAFAQLFHGRLQEAMETTASLQDASPATPEDYLFAGQALIFSDTVRAGAYLERAIEGHNSAISRSVYAFASAFRALQTNDKALATTAVKNISAARVLLGDHCFVNAMDVFVHHAAMKLGAGSVDEKTLRDILRESDGKRNYGLGHVCRAWAYGDLGDTEAADREWQATQSQGVNDWVVWYSSFLLCAMEPKEATRRLEKSGRGEPGAFSELAFVPVYAEIAEQRPLAREMAKRVIEKHKHTVLRGCGLDALMLVEGLETTRKRALELEGLGRGSSFWWTDYLVSYYAGRLTEEGLLDSAASVPDRLVVAHYLIGMKKLAEGERNSAEGHFRKSIKTHCIWSGFYWHSKARLKRMQNLVEWPDWIPRAGITLRP